jgi:hypothetical protein
MVKYVNDIFKLIRKIIMEHVESKNKKKKRETVVSEFQRVIFFFKFNVGIWASLRAPRLIPRALKLTTM